MVLNVVKGRCWVPMQQMFHYGLSAELQSFAIVDDDKSLGHCPIILVRERTEPIFEWAAKSKTVSLADSLKIILNFVKREMLSSYTEDVPLWESAQLQSFAIVDGDKLVIWPFAYHYHKTNNCTNFQRICKIKTLSLVDSLKIICLKCWSFYVDTS